MGKSIDQLRSRCSIHDIPELCLSVLPLNGQRIVICWVYLHGEVVMCIYQLDEQGKIGKLLCIPAERMLPFCRKPIREGPPRCRTVCNHAHAILMTGEFPALSDLCQLCFFTVFVPQTRPAPEVILERCSELHWIFHQSLPELYMYGTILLNRTKNCKYKRYI